MLANADSLIQVNLRLDLNLPLNLSRRQLGRTEQPGEQRCKAGSCELAGKPTERLIPSERKLTFHPTTSLTDQQRRLNFAYQSQSARPSLSVVERKCEGELPKRK